MLTFTAGECLDMIRYGKFTLLTFSVQIPKEEAVTIVPPYPYFLTPAAVEARYSLRTNYLVITSSYNWGNTSRPNKVYYEIHQFGWPFPAGISRMAAPEYKEGFLCGTHIKECDIDNQSHLFCAEDFRVLLWNATGEEPEDIYVEFAIWFYTYHKKYFHEVFNILTRNWNLMQTLIGLMRRNIMFQAGKLPDEELNDIIAKTSEESEERGIIKYG